MGNTIVTLDDKLSFIDFGFFGPRYYGIDVAMGALMIPAELRDTFLEGVYGHSSIQEEEVVRLEGFMLLSIIGFYAFQMGNEKMHDWMRERMPKLCSDYGLPYISGERIIYSI
ncbi:hypothetical protein [Paenibacillus sp. 1001270B_150601_E10]|uniref:hypothetical protein n=1 Tax=Paenibacillus sp. 1001270B_150601_E10 TaxID=2787079 RepID=UPI0018A0CEC7|nr:hypothetical protein [Paenibacillus sp. 1001270B_150601_E10]